MKSCFSRVLAVLVLCACAPSALAQVEVNAGMSITRDSETTAVGSVAWLPEWRPLHRGLLRWEVGALYLPGRNVAGADLDEGVAVVHGGLRYEPTDYGLTAGFGVGAQTGRTDALSGHPQFVSTMGWRWGRFSLLARHISNARLKEPNHGETMLLAAWRF